MLLPVGRSLALPAKVFVVGAAVLVADGTVTRAEGDALELRCALPLVPGARVILSLPGHGRVLCAVARRLGEQRYDLVRTAQPRSESRASARLVAEIGVEILPVGRLGAVHAVFAPVELSIAGLKVPIADRPPAVGDPVALRLRLTPDGAPLPLHGTVVRAGWDEGQWSVAIAFTDIPEATLDELGFFLLAQAG